MARPGPALFELIRGGSPPPPASLPKGGSEKPLVTVRPKLQAEPSRAPTPPASETPEPEIPTGKPAEKAWAAWNKGGSWLDLKQSVTVPKSALLFAAGIVLALLVVTWSMGWVIGGSRGERQATKDLKRDEIPVNHGLLENPPKAPEVKPLPQPQARQQQPQPQAPGAVAPGTLAAGMNYKLIASGLDKDLAQEMVEFLTRNGLPAAAVVDKPAGGSNNRGSYVVYATQGLTPEEHKARPTHPKRDEVDKAVERIGKQWQATKTGRTNLSDAYWKKIAG